MRSAEHAGEVPAPLPGALSRIGDHQLFEHAPPIACQRRLGLVTPGNPNIRQRALLFALVGWGPLIILAGAQGAILGTGDLISLLWQLGVHARYLVTVPLLIIAEATCATRLNDVVRNFADAEIVASEDRVRLDEAVSSVRNRLRSARAEIIAVAAAFLVALLAALTHPAEQIPIWAAPGGLTPLYSPAGWWHTLVSLPLLLLLIFGWLWRLALWAHLLWRISRLRLRLVASHPDHCGGLSFLSHSLRAFAIVAFALAIIPAGRSAYLVVSGSALPTQTLGFNIGFLLVTAALFVGPLLAFAPILLRTSQQAVIKYGAFSDRLGQAFEQKWLASRKADDTTLAQPDFSALADLYSVTANVHAVRFIPIELKDLAILAVATLLPFVPVVLLTFPLDDILAQIRKLML